MLTRIRTTQGPNSQGIATIALVAMAMLFGSTTFILKDLLDTLDPVDLLAVRFSIAAVAMVILALIVGGRDALRLNRTLIRQGTVLGVLYGIGQILQTVGLKYTSASTSGFLTGLYVIFTPVLEAILWRSRAPRRVWIASALALLGLGVLTVQAGAGFNFGPGELLTIACALVYTLHIVVTAHYATRDNATSLITVQMVVQAIICVLFALPGGIALPTTGAEWGRILYLAILCGAITGYLQIWAQARVDATTAAIVMSLEPIWSAAFAILAGQEFLTGRLLVGGGLMVTAMVIASLPSRAAATGHGIEDVTVIDDSDADDTDDPTGEWPAVGEPVFAG